MAHRLSEDIQYGVEVTGVRESASGVQVRAERGERPEAYEADRAICTVPLGVLPDIEFEPRVPAEKRTAISTIPYVDATRTVLQVDRAFWGDVTAYLEAPREPHGRIPFAGEHTDILRGTMEGAFRAGIRAVREVDGATGE